MSSERWQELRGQAPSLLGRWQIAVAGAILLGLIGGALTERKPSTAIILCVALAAVIGLAMLGDRAFPWAIVIVAVAPWYPLVSESAAGPLVQQKVLASAVAAAPLVPWLWSLALSGRRTRPSRAALLMGVLFAVLAVLIFETIGSLQGMISSGIVGYIFIGVTFLCARRFGEGSGWLAAAFGGLLVLLVLGADAYVQSPSNRIGYFAGYPITYGALVVGLLPAALLFAYQRMRLLAGALAVATAVLLIFSESRSSWVAVAVMLVVAVLLQTRAGNFKALAAVVTVIGVVAALIIGTGSLHHIVEQKLSAKITTTQSVTHRQWSYSYALETIGRRPVFGAGAPGFSAQEAAKKTTIGAIDNGYLSIWVDMGLVGLFAALIPIAVAVRVLARCLRLGVTPRRELALALGIVGMAVVTVFYDSFYWAQIDLLLAAMGGVLSVRLGRIGKPHPEPRPAPAQVAQRQAPVRLAT
jgi:O-antigen ligase